MAKTYETGNAVNVANFKKLIDAATVLAGRYRPSKPAYQLANLLSIWETAKQELLQTGQATEDENRSINSRRIAYKNYNKYSLRLVKAISSSSDASPQTIDDAKGFHRKITGVRAADLRNNKPDAEANPGESGHISVAQTSYVNLAEHFTGIYNIMFKEPTYAPAEDDLQTAFVADYISSLQSNNTNVSMATTTARNTRNSRDRLLYAETTGMVDVAYGVKDYISAAFGENSAEHKLFKKIPFRKY